jgi:uncharacterized membrane protein
LDVEKLRSEPSDALLSKFRRDAHDAVEILIDIVAAAATTVTEKAGRIVNVTASRIRPAVAPAPTATASAGQVPTVRMPNQVAPGETTEVTISLENESGQATAEFTMYSSELMASAGHRIPAEQVHFHPPALEVGPKAAGKVRVSVHVPKGTPPGTYEGLLRASPLDSLRAVLRVQVR